VGAAQNSCGVLVAVRVSTTQQVASCPSTVATARVWLGESALRRHTSTRWLVLQLLAPALLLKPWLPLWDCWMMVQPGAEPGAPAPPAAAPKEPLLLLLLLLLLKPVVVLEPPAVRVVEAPPGARPAVADAEAPPPMGSMPRTLGMVGKGAKPGMGAKPGSGANGLNGANGSSGGSGCSGGSSCALAAGAAASASTTTRAAAAAAAAAAGLRACISIPLARAMHVTFPA
jgi:uncharacterized membrane protein YgcG